MMITVFWWGTGQEIMRTASNPLHGRTVVAFYTNGLNRTAQECDTDSAGFWPLWHAQVIKTPSVNAPVDQL